MNDYMKSKGCKVAFHNLGCKVNSYETEAMLGQLLRAGYESAPFEPGADVYVINTCTVTNIADRKSRQMLHRARKMNPDALVVAVGCYAQANKESLAADELIDLVIGNDRKGELAELIQAAMESRLQERLHVSDIGAERTFEELPAEGTEHTRAYLKVEDGCNQFCSYCLIPYVRGRVRSRVPEKVVEQAERLVAQGYREIVLTGIHLSSYGLDFEGDAADRGSYGEPLLDLIDRIAAIPKLERIRLGSLEPRIITERSAERLAACSKLCPHFHLSLQSGSDSVLRRMNRKYDTRTYYEKCRLLRRYFDNPDITTDVIVGFPGETQEEFEQTKAFLEEIRLYETHVFRYSRRKGTAADRMPGQLPEAVKAQRSEALIALGEKNRRDFEQSYIGKEVEVLLEEAVSTQAGERMAGHTREYIRLLLDLSSGASGDICRVKVTQDMLGM